MPLYAACSPKIVKHFFFQETVEKILYRRQRACVKKASNWLLENGTFGTEISSYYPWAPICNLIHLPCIYCLGQKHRGQYLWSSAVCGRQSPSPLTASWSTWPQWSSVGRPKKNPVVPWSNGMCQRVSWWKYPRSGTTSHWRIRERRQPLNVCTDWSSLFIVIVSFKT